MTEVTVLLPVRDGARTLALAMVSVLEQSFRDFELLVLDDGSVDASPEIALGFGDPRVRLLRQANSGVAAANTKSNTDLTGGLINAAGGAGAAVAGTSKGGMVKGGKVNAPGDSESNDTVPTMLSPGELVIPRSKAHDPEKAKLFIDHLLGESKKPSKKETSFGDVLAAKRRLKAA